MSFAAGQIVEADDIPTGSVQVDDPTNAASALSASSTPSLGTTTCGVAFVAPASGKARVHGAFLFSISGSGSLQVFMGVMVREGATLGSGTIVFDPSADVGNKVGGAQTGVRAGGVSTLLTGLTPGASYNVTAVFFAPAGTSPACQYFARSVGADPMW